MTQQNQTSKNARREHAREVARQLQEEQRKRRKRNRLFLQGGLGVVFLAIVAIVILVIVNTNSGNAASVASAAGPQNMATNGILFTGSNGQPTPVLTAGVPASGTAQPVAPTSTDGTVKVVTYIDWACPVCKQFEATYSTQLLSLVGQGKATLEIHPVSILDRNYQNSRYASRAANAAACVANFDPNQFLAVQTQFYDNQPAEGSNGLTNDQIKSLVVNGGVNDPNVTSCIDNETFKSWVTAETNSTISNPTLTANGGFGTPTVIVNGTRWDQSSDLIAMIQNA
jgi:protein-disulfide isomerase